MRAVLTGASSGIGRALALELARGGADLVLIARRAGPLEEVVAECRRLGASARALPLDVADTGALVAALRAADDERPLDLVIANAGVDAPRGVDPVSWEAAEAPCRVTFLGAAATVTAVLPRMVARRSGHVVGISSIAAVGGPLPRAAAYSASKAGLSMLLDCLRLDVAPSGVAVTAVHPGFVDTPMNAGADHPMPLRWSAERAARFVLTRLRSRPATIDFPWTIAFAARASTLVPRPLRDRLLRWLRP